MAVEGCLGAGASWELNARPTLYGVRPASVLYKE